MKTTLAALAVLALTSVATAQNRPSLDKLNLEKKNLAIEGYDPVAYFPEGGGKPAEGKSSLTVTHRGVTYRFANEQNRRRFLDTPVRYEPAYGGWCAWAMIDGDRTKPDPKSFKIVDEKLYLFYDGLFGDTRALWNQRIRHEAESKLIETADSEWAAQLND